MAVGIVHWIPDSKGQVCGYCQSKDSSFSKGMWASVLSAQNYQDLIDRGWRRYGKYCYKPEMSKTCCPQYTIRCDALAFKPTKSHKKILKKMHKFLLNGRQESEKNETGRPNEDEFGQISEADICSKVAAHFGEQLLSHVVTDAAMHPVSGEAASAQITPAGSGEAQEARESGQRASGSFEEKRPHNEFSTKKKALRKQRWLEKQKAKNLPLDPPVAKNHEKTLEEWLDLPQGKHKLEIRLVRSAPYGPEAKRTEGASYQVYKRYQMQVHNEPETKVGLTTWNQLVDSPLVECPLLGTFHQQYWLDNRLIAVGILDLLPLCVSAVYFYYDPKFEFLSLGTFSSLTEILLARELHKSLPSMKYYYMGYYIHSCPKMRYKGKLPNSDLLCPEAYTWHAIQNCVPLLDASKYARLEPDNTLKDWLLPTDISHALLAVGRRALRMTDLPDERKLSEAQLAALKEYCELVGSKVMKAVHFAVK